MPTLMEILAREQRLIQQKQEIRQLRDELVKLRAQNERMRQGMRRCTTCEYRLEVVGRS
jgi:uncharacterized protein with PIN domain